MSAAAVPAAGGRARRRPSRPSETDMSTGSPIAGLSAVGVWPELLLRPARAAPVILGPGDAVIAPQRLRLPVGVTGCRHRSAPADCSRTRRSPGTSRNRYCSGSTRGGTRSRAAPTRRIGIPWTTRGAHGAARGRDPVCMPHIDVRCGSGPSSGADRYLEVLFTVGTARPAPRLDGRSPETRQRSRPVHSKTGMAVRTVGGATAVGGYSAMVSR